MIKAYVAENGLLAFNRLYTNCVQFLRSELGISPLQELKAYYKNLKVKQFKNK